MSVFLSKEIEAALKESKEILDKFISTDFFLCQDKKKLLIKSNLQSFSSLKTQNKLLNSIIEIVISNAIEAEKISPGAFEKTIKFWLKKEEFKDDCQYAANLEDLKEATATYLENNQLNGMVLDAINLAGFRGMISIEKSSNLNASIELIEDYRFDCNYLDKQVKLLKPKVICIDGYVASVGELNLLFESLVKNGSQLVIIAKGFDEEVISTIKVNNTRNIFSVYPVTIPFVLENINTVADIATVVGVLPISSHLGQIISSVDISSACSVDEIKLTRNNILIKNKKTKKNVNLHVSELIEKLKNSKDTNEIYERRIKSLSCNNVIIRLPDDKNFIENSYHIDFYLRTIKSILSFGISKDKKISATDISGNIFSKKIDDLIKNLGSVIHH